MAQVALAWLRYRPVPVIPILGARKLSQLQDNLASFNLAFPLLAPAQIESPRASPALSSVLVDMTPTAPVAFRRFAPVKCVSWANCGMATTSIVSER